MGTVTNVSASRFPKQDEWVGRRTMVCFSYDTSRQLEGVIVRDDSEAPWVTIIHLANGRYVLATECQYAPLLDDKR